ncbi:MAG: hypothetical protein U5L45_25085 [Saprospiraceae bacterium]|nr:hypothetical protein [Saprospiraceae bacterium]
MLHSRKKGEIVSFSGFARKTNHLSFFANEESCGLSNYVLNTLIL